MIRLDKTKFHIEEVFENLMGLGKYKIEECKEGITDYVIWVKIYDMFNMNDLSKFTAKGFVFEYVEPRKDADGEPYMRIRFRATPQ